MHMTDRLCFEVDLPMARVKFNVNTEYGFLQNFKILQSTSTQSLYHSRILSAQRCNWTILIKPR